MSVRVSIVSYTNTLPFLYGLQQYEDISVTNTFLVQKQYPSLCAASLLSGETDIALAPVAVLADNPGLQICSDYCIGAVGPVDSVLLLCNEPIENISTIITDYQSRTSNILVRVLARHYWNVHPVYVAGTAGYEESASQSEAVVVIGDRAFEYRPRYAYCYDLAEEWHKMTGMPFVFALWLSAKALDDGILTQFNKILQFGIRNTSAAIALAGMHPAFDLEDYLLRKISYPLDEAKKRALNLFLHYAQSVV